MKIKITIEGVEGSGKTTAAALCAKTLEAAGYSVTLYDDLKNHPISDAEVTIVVYDRASNEDRLWKRLRGR